MRRMLAAAAAGAAAGMGLAACFELSGPPSDLTAISRIQVAWPSVVVGDALRDSRGDTAALVVEAYGGDGQPVDDAEVRYIVLDRGLHVTEDGVVIGDSARSSPARVVAQVRRGGSTLQTPEVSIDVVPMPDSVTPAQDTTFTAKPIPAADPSPIVSDPLTIEVYGKGAPGVTATPVRSWIVEYEILTQPAGVNDQNTALFAGGGGARSSLDTTDATGTASRAISLQRALLVTSLGRQDVTVRATVRRVGALSETRTVVFTLPFVGQ